MRRADHEVFQGHSDRVGRGHRFGEWGRGGRPAGKDRAAGRLCPHLFSFGASFFYIPGTESCLRIGGRVRAEALIVEPLTRADDLVGLRARGRIQLDHRTATDYGLLRAFVRFEITHSSGLPYGNPGTVGTTAKVPQAFVQFAGLTAGRVTSMFSNTDLPLAHMGTLRFDDVPDVMLLAYTYSFGNGFSATISVEDSLVRRQNNAFDPIPGTAALVPGGQSVPDVVGNLRYVGTWGSVQVSGALPQIRSDNLVIDPFTGFTSYPGAEYGFAAGFQGALNLPNFGPADAAWLSLGYADGALGYIGFGSELNNVFGAGPVSTPAVDAYVDTATGDLRRAKGFSVAGGYTHNWTPQLRSSVFGSFARVTYSGPASTLGPLGNVTGLPDFNEWRVGTNSFWIPVTGLAFGAELIYVRADPKGHILALQSGTGGSFPRLIGSDSTIEGRLRIQRDF